MANAQGLILGIIAEARDKYTVHECSQCAWRKCCSRGFGSEECGKFRESIFLHLGIEDGYFTQLLDRLEAAHKREIDVLKQRCAELNAEVAAKDEVIKRLNDAISEEQMRKMATTENTSAVGDAAKLREALGNLRAELWNNTVIAGKRKFELYEIADAALAEPPRNCDKYSHDEALRIWSAEPENPMNGCFDVWLYAPATEKEGVAK